MSKHKKIHVTPSHTKKVFANMKRQGKDFSGRDTPLFPTMIVQAQEQVDADPVTDDTENVASVPTHSNDPLLSAAKITELKERVKKLEKKGGSRTHRLGRLYKVSRSARVVSSDDEGLGDQEDASKQGSKIADIDVDTEVTLVDDTIETQGRFNDDLTFDTDVSDEQEVEVEKEVSTVDPVTTAGEVVTTTNVEVTTDNATTTTVDELTLAQTLIEIKAAKPKVRGVMIQEPSEFTTTTTITPATSKPSQDKGKAKMIEPEMPLKKKDKIILQEEEQGELIVEEKSKIFVELMDKRKKHFVRLRAEEQRRKPLTKAQKRNQMCTYLKNIVDYKQSQLKNKSFAEIQKLFDKAMTRVNMFVDMDTEFLKESSKKAEVEMAQETNSKREGEELE
ncbi:hypothetical protein Tco_1009625 [Tanacetum coccineum]